MSYQEVSEKIKRLGIKKFHVAAKCLIPNQVFSEFLNGKRDLKYLQYQKVQEYLAQFDNVGNVI